MFFFFLNDQYIILFVKFHVQKNQTSTCHLSNFKYLKETKDFKYFTDTNLFIN